MKKTINPGDKFYYSALMEMNKDNPSISKTTELLNFSLKAHNNNAAYALAAWYLHGAYGIKKDLRRALKLLKIAASHDISDALFDLAVCYELGCGVRKNYNKALILYTSAALNGDISALHEVGRCFYYGFGTAVDRKMARVWLDIHSKKKELGVDVKAKTLPHGYLGSE